MRHRNHRGEGLAEQSRELEGLQEVLDEEGGGGHARLPLSRLSTGTYVATWRPLKLLRLVAVLLELTDTLATRGVEQPPSCNRQFDMFEGER